MTRRAFVPAAMSAAAVSASAADESPKPSYVELRRYQLRNSAENQRQRTTEFLRLQSAALQRAGDYGVVIQSPVTVDMRAVKARKDRVA